MTLRPLKFGIHDFLNAGPLLTPLMENGAGAGLRMVTGSPAALADRLRSGDLDLAMIPSIEYLKAGGAYRLVPGVCIASRGPVGTVLLLAKKPPEKIASLAADLRSRTSVALVEILFEFAPGLVIHRVSPDPTAMLKEHDAALIIGDRALALVDPGPGVMVYDLSEEWLKQTGKTFVHAVVAVRSGVTVDPATVDFIQGARREGCGRIEEIARAHRGLDGVALDVRVDYLKGKIRYHLGAEEMEGLAHFRDLAHRRGLLAEGKVSFRFV